MALLFASVTGTNSAIRCLSTSRSVDCSKLRKTADTIKVSAIEPQQIKIAVEGEIVPAFTIHQDVNETITLK